MNQAAPRARSWLVGTTIHRARSQGRLLTVVIAVAILATTLISALGLLVTATEQGAVRGALASIPSAQTTIEVQVMQPFISIAKTRSLIDSGVTKVLGGAATASTFGVSLSQLSFVPVTAPLPRLTYFGEYDGIRSQVILTSGVWASAPTGSEIPVTVPAVAAKALGYHLGSTFTVNNDPRNVRAKIVGMYRITDPSSSYWNLDPLHGKGFDPTFAVPNVTFYEPSDTLGPLLAAPGVIASSHVRVALVDVTYRPRFGSTTVDALAPLARRLAHAEDNVTAQVGNHATSVYYDSNAGDAVTGVVSGLVVTRSTVVVVSLLLLVLAVVAMAQTARLLTESRAGERQLMRSRGASARNIIALTLVEAVILGVLTAVVSPLLANLVYRALAAQPAMRAARMPADAGLPLATWATAAGIAVVFVIVLVVPLLQQARTFVEGEQSKGRQRAASGIMRSGLDIAFVVLAGVAYWQLKSYHSPVATSASLGVDPILVAGPALVLLAGALLAVRLIPAAARILERIGSRTRGSVVPLAAWEIGRRSQRATAAVLLLSLALGVGSFGLSFLETWRQSQLDQATLAVGPPVRVQASDAIESVRTSDGPAAPTRVAGAGAIFQATELSVGAQGAPQPTIRRAGLVGPNANDPSSSDQSGVQASVLGLTAPARAMIDRGRLASEGGARVRTDLENTPTPTTGIVLPGTPNGLSATVEVGQKVLPGVSASLNAILEDANGLLTTIDFGSAKVDGQPHTVTGTVPSGTGKKKLATPLRFVGFQATYFTPNSVVNGGNPSLDAHIRLKDLAALHLTSAAGAKTPTYSTQALQLPAKPQWYGMNADAADTRPTTGTVAKGWQLDLGVVIPTNVNAKPATFSLVGWDPVLAMSGVIPSNFEQTLNVQPGDSITVTVQGVPLHISLSGTAGLIPGTATSDVLTAGSAGLSESASQAAMVVVDQVQLARALAQSGVPGPMADEWWVDVAPGHGQAYLAAHKGETGIRSADVLGLQLQQSPLRVATQAALWLAILAGALLAAVGFVVHSTTTMRARRLELAQLRAIGLSRNKLVGLVAAESMLLAVLGAVFGIAIGLLLVWLVGPLVAVSPDGTPAVPSVIVEIPWPSIGLLVVGLAAVLAIVVLVVARVQRFVEPAELLRGGSEL